MILGFKTQANGQPTGFVEKINAGTKIHTLREDVNQRWKPGNTIQFATGVRTKDYDQFKCGHCRSVQTVELSVSISRYPTLRYEALITVDGHTLDYAETDEFIKNDGFDSVEEFFNWFSPVCGPENFVRLRLIHWTDFRY